MSHILTFFKEHFMWLNTLVFFYFWGICKNSLGQNLTHSSEHTFLTVVLLILASFATWIGWDFPIIKSWFLLFSCSSVYLSLLSHFTVSCEMKPVSLSSFGLEISLYIPRKAYFPHVYRLNFPKLSAMISVFGIHISANKLLQAMKTFSISLLKILPTAQFLSQFYLFRDVL